MVNRVIDPNLQFADSTGTPYVGGTLDFYASGTSTRLNTYADQALTVANPNPIVLDSRGAAGNVFLQDLAYKLVLKDAQGNQVYTADPLYTSDFSAVAQFSTFPGDPNGHVAGTAGSGSIPASAVFDTVNRVLYIATSTGTAATTTWFAVNPATSSAPVVYPGGYLTPVQGQAVLTSDTDNPYSQIFYSPYSSNLVPIFNGTNFTTYSFLTSTALGLVAAHEADSLYDIFVFNNAGTATLATGPKWATLTSRGTGPGTTQITNNLNGIWVNLNPLLTPLNGANTYSAIAPNFATYLGTFYTDHTAGQVSVHVTYGQNRKHGIWNAYNRLPIYLKCGDPGASYTCTGSAPNFNPSNGTGVGPGSPLAADTTIIGVNQGGTAISGLNFLQGLAEENLNIQFIQHITPGANSGTSRANISIALNAAGSVTAVGKVGYAGRAGTQGNIQPTMDAVASYIAPPILGLTTVTAIEATDGTGGGTPTMFGTETGMLLEARWRG